MRAVAYIRTAAPSLSEESAQERAIAAWAARERVEIASWQVDAGVDGAAPIAERPGLLGAYRAIRAHGARVLVAASVDRFAEDQLVAWLVERAALVEGATMDTADGSRATPPGSARPEDVGYTRGAVELARAYRRVVVGARVRAVLADKRARGERVGNVPYGYRLSADGVHTEPDENEQSVIVTVRTLSGEGLSQRAIVARLAERGVVGRTGGPLRQTQVAKILRLAV